jgi:DNA-directed RNA polymerase specialized sigma24 family protein
MNCRQLAFYEVHRLQISQVGTHGVHDRTPSGWGHRRPDRGQVVALAGVFGVEPSYLLDRGEPVFDGELVEALRDEAVREATREISRLPERERRVVLGIVRQFGDQGAESSV